MEESKRVLHNATETQPHILPSSKEAEKLFMKGLDAFKQGRTLCALACFEKANSLDSIPLYQSHIACCIAKERGQINKAISLCEEAIQQEPDNAVHYLNLGRVYLHKGDKENAVRAFREGLRHELNQDIMNELYKLVTRKPPVIAFLKRENPVNKYLGMLLGILRLR